MSTKLEMLANRVAKNRRRLRSWITSEGVSCYRIYDRDIPEIPCSIDWYEGRLYVCSYERVREEDAPDEIPELVAGLAERLGVATEMVFVKTRRRQRGDAQYQRLAVSGERFLVTENGYRFWVNLSDYLDTGIFLDHRRTRKIVGELSAGKRVLNLFCYTGSFTVYAAKGGAAASTSVDMSKRYLSWARDNLDANQISHDKHALIRDDVLAFLEREREPRFDLAVVDPPTFSNSKKMQGAFDVQRDHVDVLRKVVDLVVPGGVVFFSTNLRTFKLGDVGLPGLEVAEISAETLPKDFRNQRIHKSYQLKKICE